MITMPTAHIALLMLDFHIPESGSLKSKRRVISSIKEKIKSKFNVSVAELGELDKWQRTIFGVVMIGNDKPFIESSISSVLNFAEGFREAELIDSRIEYL